MAMKRDQKLILKILRHVRDATSAVEQGSPPDFKGVPREVVQYHLRLCKEAGFLRLHSNGTLDTMPKYELTWATKL